METSVNPETETTRAAIIAVVGRTNVGKSTLLNAMLGEKVSIVSPVVQTTRNVIRAIRTEPRGQLVFLDTPGVHKASYDLGRMMNKMARASVEGTDMALLVLDVARPPQDEDEGWMRRMFRDEAAPCIGVLNKSDLGARYTKAYHELWARIAAEKNSDRSIHWCPVSAMNGEGVEALVTYCFEVAPPGPNLFPEDVLTDYPRKLAMADVIREKYIPHLREELPHALAVWIDSIEEEEGVWRVEGQVYVSKHSQKGIVLGAKGRLLKRVTAESEKELSEIYGQRVKLKLWVKEQKDWMKNFWLLKKMGYA